MAVWPTADERRAPGPGPLAWRLAVAERANGEELRMAALEPCDAF
jgi:hypothetical protein